MGKGALVAAAFVLASTMTLLFNTQLQSRETEKKEYSRQANQVARELAMEGRKIVLADWITQQAGGSAIVTQPFSSKDKDGGRIQIVNYTPTSNTIDFTIQADYDSTVHEVRSRFQWDNFPVSPVQVKTWRLDPTIDPAAVLGFNELAIDKQNVEDLDSILVNDLGLISWIGGCRYLLDEGPGGVYTDLETELNTSGNTHLTPMNVIDNLNRETLAGQEGLLFPDQVNQIVTEFALAYPALHQTVSDISGLGGTFGYDGTHEMLTVEQNLTLSSDFTGKGYSL